MAYTNKYREGSETSHIHIVWKHCNSSIGIRTMVGKDMSDMTDSEIWTRLRMNGKSPVKHRANSNLSEGSLNDVKPHKFECHIKTGHPHIVKMCLKAITD